MDSENDPIGVEGPRGVGSFVLVPMAQRVRVDRKGTPLQWDVYKVRSVRSAPFFNVRPLEPSRKWRCPVMAAYIEK